MINWTFNYLVKDFKEEVVVVSSLEGTDDTLS
jgi:hypothetical protein